MKNTKQLNASNAIEQLSCAIDSNNLQPKVTNCLNLSLGIRASEITDLKLKAKVLRLQKSLELSAKLASEINHEYYQMQDTMTEYYRHCNFLSEKVKIEVVLNAHGISFTAFEAQPENIVCMDYFTEIEKKQLMRFNKQYL